MKTSSADYYTCNEDEESLTCTDPDDAVDEYIEQRHIPGTSDKDFIASLPEEITVYAYDRMKIDEEHWAQKTLEELLESLDDEVGEDGAITEPTRDMKEAARAFMTCVMSEYRIWACRQVGTIRVNLMEWLKENEPEWLKEIQEEKDAITAELTSELIAVEETEAGEEKIEEP